MRAVQLVNLQDQAIEDIDSRNGRDIDNMCSCMLRMQIDRDNVANRGVMYSYACMCACTTDISAHRFRYR
jgi:hypothetical protein